MAFTMDCIFGLKKKKISGKKNVISDFSGRIFNTSRSSSLSFLVLFPSEDA
jgi:hypothetical protein